MLMKFSEGSSQQQENAPAYAGEVLGKFTADYTTKKTPTRK